MDYSKYNNDEYSSTNQSDIRSHIEISGGPNGRVQFYLRGQAHSIRETYHNTFDENSVAFNHILQLMAGMNVRF